MRRLMLLVVLVVAWVPAVLALEVGVVDMERVIQEHPRTARDRATLEQYVTDFEGERDEQLEELRALSETFESLRAEAEDIGLSPEAVRDRQQRAQLKLEEMRQKEAALREMVAARQRELSMRERRMRGRVVADIGRVLEGVAEARGLDLILDGGADPAGGYGAVLFSKDAYEVTDEVLLQIRDETQADEDS